MFSIDIFSLASTIGTIAFALSGFMVGVRKDLDIMGIFILSMLTANGGGAVRDVLVGRLPNVLTDIYAFLIVVAVMVGAWMLRLHHRPASRKSFEKSPIFVISDSLGLVAFSVTGTLVGIESGLSIFGVMVLAFITASGGGIIRDLMVNEVPAVLNSDFYGTVAILLGAVMYGLHLTPYYNDTSLTALFVAALVMRLIAYNYGWKLPRIRKD
jgi:uncharacterized membrane protein YeiH